MGAETAQTREYAVRTYGHSGSTTAGQANMLFDPDSRTGLVVMSNEPNGNDFLFDTPALVFGELSPDKYVSDTVEMARLNGYYLPARSTYRGMLKFIPYLSAILANRIGNIQNIGNRVYPIIGRTSPLLSERSERKWGMSVNFLPKLLTVSKICDIIDT